MKKIVVFLLVLAMLMFETAGVLAALKPLSKPPIKTELNQKANQQEKALMPRHPRLNPLDVLEPKPKMTKEEFEAKRAELKNSIEKEQTEWRNQMELKREQLKSQIEAQRKNLEKGLAKIKDETKKKIVERIYNQVGELNKRMTDHFLNVLEKLEKVLERISSRAAKVEANGRDISAVKTFINEASNAISEAKTAVSNQAAKVYAAPVVKSENVLKTEVGKIRQALHNDLKLVFDKVKAAQEAVRKAATSLAQIPKVDELEISSTTTPALEGTTTPTTTQPNQ